MAPATVQYDSFEPYLSSTARNVVRNPIRKVMLKVHATPGCVSLAGGRPPKAVFPQSVHAWEDENLMNYGPALAAGSDELRKWAKDFVERFHSPPASFAHHDTLITSGNTDGMTKAVLLLSEPGDVVLADEVTYPGITASAIPLGRRVLGVPIDEDGMIPDQLEAVLQSLDGNSRPRMLYLTPHGGNPTGITIPESRKDALYNIARKHGLVILEDDPYFFVQLAPHASGTGGLSEEDMVGERAAPRSFLARDVDGRVVRLDSVSKTIAPGYRLGWVTGHKSLMEKWSILSEVLTWSVSGIQQKSLLDLVKQWGQDGFHRHLQQLQSTYALRCGYLLAACEKHLTGLCSWSAPKFGMFVWLQIHGCEDTDSIVEELISSFGIAMVPGASFKTPEGAGPGSDAFFRVSFSLISSADAADKAMLKLRSFLDAGGHRKKAVEEEHKRRAAEEKGLESGAAKRPRSES